MSKLGEESDLCDTNLGQNHNYLFIADADLKKYLTQMQCFG